MKSKKMFIFLLIFAGIFFINPTNVSAAKKLGTCSYKLPQNFGNLAGFKLDVTLYDDKTTTREASLGSWKVKNGDFQSGLLIGDSGMYTQYSKMFNQDGKYYKEYASKKNCPTLDFIWYSNSSQLHFYIANGTTKDPDGNVSKAITPSITGGSVTGSTRKVICTRTKPVSNNGYEVKLTFVLENGKKVLEIGRAGSNDVQGRMYPESSNKISVNGVLYEVSNDIIATHWSSKADCQKDLFFRAIGGDFKNIMIQATKPDAVENASTGADDQSDTGTEDVDEADGDISFVDTDQDQDCQSILGRTDDENSVAWLLMKFLNYVKIIGPVLVILLSSFDFVKAIISSDEDAMKKAQKKFIFRLVLAIAVFFVPLLVGVLLEITGIVNSDPTCGFDIVD